MCAVCGCPITNVCGVLFHNGGYRGLLGSKGLGDFLKLTKRRVSLSFGYLIVLKFINSGNHRKLIFARMQILFIVLTAGLIVRLFVSVSVCLFVVARRSAHKFSSVTEEAASLIYMHTPTFTGENTNFEQAYFF